MQTSEIPAMMNFVFISAFYWTKVTRDQSFQVRPITWWWEMPLWIGRLPTEHNPGILATSIPHHEPPTCLQLSSSTQSRTFQKSTKTAGRWVHWTFPPLLLLLCFKWPSPTWNKGHVKWMQVYPMLEVLKEREPWMTDHFLNLQTYFLMMGGTVVFLLGSKCWWIKYIYKYIHIIYIIRVYI